MYRIHGDAAYGGEHLHMIQQGNGCRHQHARRCQTVFIQSHFHKGKKSISVLCAQFREPVFNDHHHISEGKVAVETSGHTGMHHRIRFMYRQSFSHRNTCCHHAHTCDQKTNVFGSTMGLHGCGNFHTGCTYQEDSHAAKIGNSATPGRACGFHRNRYLRLAGRNNTFRWTSHANEKKTWDWPS